jgi:methyl-accepting chemotaxis protein
MNNLTLKAKLFMLVGVALVALAIVGAVGWMGLTNTAASVYEIGKVRMPSVLGLEIINEGQTAVRSNNRYVSTFENDYKAQDKFAEALKTRSEIWRRIDEGWKIYEPLPQTKEEAVLWKQFVKEWDEWKASDARLSEVIAALSRNGSEAEQKALFVKYYEQAAATSALFGSAEATLGKIIDLNVRVSDEAVVDGEKTVSMSKTIMLTGSIAMLAILLLLGVWITRSILIQMGGEPAYVAEVVKRVADGDLTVKVETRANDTSSMLYGVKGMVNSLTEIVTGVRDTTESITTASQEIAQGNADLSQRTEEQASSLEETASSMEELTTTVRQNTENAKQANQLAANASNIAVKGGHVVGDVVGTMASISDSSRKIVDIISVIEGIAFQTNILALNAAVEAARAGEQGRGFAVVAGEVRNLAQRSAAAAKEIKTLIDDSVNKVDAGSKQVDQAGATMTEIVQAVKRVTDIMAEIAAASNEQSAGIEQVNQAIMQMDEVTQQNAALVEEAAAAAEALQEQSEVLMEAVSIFKLEAGRASAQKTAEKSAAKAVARTASAPAYTHHRAPSTEVATRKERKVANSRENHEGDWKEF